MCTVGALATASNIPASSTLAEEPTPGMACALKATKTHTASAAYVYVHVGTVVVTLDTRVAHALFWNYVTVYVGGDGHRHVEHLQLTLQSLWQSHGPIELLVVLNMRHRWR